MEVSPTHISLERLLSGRREKEGLLSSYRKKGSLNVLGSYERKIREQDPKIMLSRLLERQESSGWVSQHCSTFGQYLLATLPFVISLWLAGILRLTSSYRYLGFQRRQGKIFL